MSAEAAVQAVAWDFDSGVVTVTFDGEAIDEEALKAVIDDAGFPAEPAALPTAVSPAPPPLAVTPPGPVADALAAAAAAGRPVVIDFGAVWCASCQRLEHETLADPDVLEALDDWTLIQVDADDQAEVAEGWGVGVLPTLVFLDGTGRVAARVEGFQDPAAFLAILTSVRSP